MKWQDEYNHKTVTPEQAVAIVKSGNRVGIPLGGECMDLTLALCARKNELSGVEVYLYAGGNDAPWLGEGWEKSFVIKSMYLNRSTRAMLDEKRGHYIPSLTAKWPPGLPDGRPEPRWEPVDVAMLVVSSPDENGYCSFGSSVWNKKTLVNGAKVVICGVEESYIRTYGDNYIHVSEIDHFVKNTPIPRGVPPWTLDETAVTVGIANNVSQLIRDRDTLQIGGGSTTYPLVTLGILDGRSDIGWHSELTVPGVVDKIRDGVVNSKYKTINKGVATGTAMGNSPEDLKYIQDNPQFALYGVDYVNNIVNIASHENMVAINNILQIDFTGQANAESFGPRQYSGTGGQFEFAVGATLSQGGRSILVLPSTALEGSVSNILPTLPLGTIVTTPRNVADYVVTEHGIANLAGKSHKERALALISVADPKFRTELTEDFHNLY